MPQEQRIIDMSFALPFPISCGLSVYRDDGRWVDYRKWFMRSNTDLLELFVEQYAFKLDELGDPDISIDEWSAFSEQLVTNNPGCVFIYSSTYA